MAYGMPDIDDSLRRNQSAIGAALSPTITGNSNIAKSPASKRPSLIPLVQSAMPGAAFMNAQPAAAPAAVPQAKADPYLQAIEAAGAPAITNSMIPGAGYGNDYAEQVRIANQEGGAPGAIAAAVRGAPGMLPAVLDDTLRMVKPAIDPFAQTLKGVVTGDFSPIKGDGAPSITNAVNANSAQPARVPVTPTAEDDAKKAQNPIAKPMQPAASPAASSPAKEATGTQPLSDSGNLSVYTNPETAGMTPQQAIAYWQSQSDRLDAKQARRDLEAQLSASIVQSGDSIGTIQAKRSNAALALRQLNELDARMNQIGEAQKSLMPNVQNAIQGKLDQTKLDSADAETKAKQLSLNALTQIENLKQRYLKTTDPAEQKRLQQQIQVLNGKVDPKYQIATEEGLADDGITKVKTAYAIDPATGQTFKVSDMAGGNAGSAQQKASPYPEGTQLRGKDGKTYVVKGGVPVPQ